MICIQLDMFDKTDSDRLWREIAAINRGRDRERKRLFKEIGELKKEVAELKRSKSLQRDFF